MALWTYKCYVDGSQPNLWRRWYDAHPEVRGKHDSVFGMLEQQVFWVKPHVKMLKNHDGLLEVILNGRVQWRIFGFQGAGKEFVVVGTGNHKANVYDPKGILTTARGIMKDIKAGSKGAISCERPE